MPPPQRTGSNNDKPIKRPVCPTCLVPMWLTKIVTHPPGDKSHDRYYFECKVCDSLAILPPLGD